MISLISLNLIIMGGISTCVTEEAGATDWKELEKKVLKKTRKYQKTKKNSQELYRARRRFMNVEKEITRPRDILGMDKEWRNEQIDIKIRRKNNMKYSRYLAEIHS